jgi:hypothetical protein
MRSRVRMDVSMMHRERSGDPTSIEILGKYCGLLFVKNGASPNRVGGGPVMMITHARGVRRTTSGSGSIDCTFQGHLGEGFDGTSVRATATAGYLFPLLLRGPPRDQPSGHTSPCPHKG